MAKEQVIPPNAHFIIKVNVEGIGNELSEKLMQLTTKLQNTPIEVTCISEPNITDYNVLKGICNYTIPTEIIRYYDSNSSNKIGIIEAENIEKSMQDVNPSVFPKFQTIQDSAYTPNNPFDIKKYR